MVSDSKYKKGMNSIIMQIHHLRGTSKIFNKKTTCTKGTQGLGLGYMGNMMEQALWSKVFS